MPKRMRVPAYAKIAAKRGLQEREENKAGLTPSQAKVLGVASGVSTARAIIDRQYLQESLLKRIARFYMRFKNFKTSRAETALRLWGGRRFGALLARIYYSK